ncbi:hypothetical protein [Streptomyces anulatus]|uniref:hypothetical protein n=1 Tax=Streptomyces anulatus TaxID=1892 RepID=UPI0037DD3442|nr:hypothetical protein OHB50_39450 [Streptomyces anulatus]
MPKAGITYGPRIAPPDYAKIKKDAADGVLEQLGPIARPDMRVAEAAEVVRQADAEIALHLDERNAATASLWFYEQRQSLAKTIGVTSTEYREILSESLLGDPLAELPTFETNEELVAFAKKQGVRHIPDAAEKVLESARIVAAAQARKKTAVRFLPKYKMTYGPRIAPPDYAKIQKDAEDGVLKKLGPVARPDLPADQAVEAVGRPDSSLALHLRQPGGHPDMLVAQAAEVVRQADAEIALHLDERNDATASLWFYEQRMSLAKTIGVTPTAYREILSKSLLGDARKQLPTFETNKELVAFAKKQGVRHIPDAAEKILEPARIVAAARARRKAAVRFMQEAVLALSEKPYDWDPEKIADHAGVQRKLVYQQRAAARKRHGL